MKVVLVDDHPLVRQGLVSLLSTEPDIQIEGEAATINEAIVLIKKLTPDIALIDLILGKEYGLDIVHLLKEEGVNCRFIILTSSTDILDFVKAQQIGVDGYILKDAFPEEIIYAMRLVSKGRRYYDPQIFEFKETNEIDNKIDFLTPREKEVLSALGQGLSNRDLAKKLYITETTAKKHVSQILAKLELTDRTQAAIYANTKGLVKFQ